MELLVAYQKQSSVQLRNRLVRLNMGLVRTIAHRLARQCAEPYEDLEQCGSLGLITAIERFDLTQGYAFSSFAVPYIRGEILHFLRDRGNTIRLPRRWQQLHRQGQKVQQALTMELGYQPSAQEVADALGLSMNEWRSVQLAACNRVPLSLNARISPNQQLQSDSALTLGDALVDAHAQMQQLEADNSAELQYALAQIEEKTREVIQLVFFNQLSRKEVAQHMGISPITVTRRINRGLEELKSLLQQPLPAIYG
jgi:RNA polymerase sigma-B factor